ncbi:polyketide synthase dehydratase domain-containing protein [Mycolicibacter icosiumassiliensis]|uniref:polyketide synthase dehydratase domain-containing protein n=1 Tax=Mycolicibacter icosiumassiliensis TaxID=1792835 RepID=UPI00142FEA67
MLATGPDARTATAAGGSAAGHRRRAGPPRPWATDPAAVDGCLQAALVWSYQLLGRNVLPLRVGEIIRYRSGALGSGLRCVLTGGDAKTSRAVCDLDLVDADNQLVISLKRLELYPYGG